MEELTTLLRGRSFHHGEPVSPFIERAINQEQIFWGLYLCDNCGKNILIYLYSVCALHQPENTCGGLWQTCLQIWKCSGHQPPLLWRSVLQLAEQRFSLSHRVCFLCASSKVGTCLAVLWEYVWLLVSDQCVPEEGPRVTEGTGKAELLCWPLERGRGLSLARSTFQERLGCYGGEW